MQSPVELRIARRLTKMMVEDLIVVAFQVFCDQIGAVVVQVGV